MSFGAEGIYFFLQILSYSTDEKDFMDAIFTLLFMFKPIFLAKQKASNLGEKFSNSNFLWSQ